MALQLNLPKINGNIEAGIAVGVDPGLPDADTLVYPTDINNYQELMSVALRWGLDRRGGNLNTEASKLFISGIAAAYSLNLVRQREAGANAPFDGDVMKVHSYPRLTDEQIAMVKPYTEVVPIQRAASIIAATKINWWLMNHHTGVVLGNDNYQGYLKKVLTFYYPNAVTFDLVRVVQQLGHFCSTREVLTRAGIEGIAPTFNVQHGGNGHIIMSSALPKTSGMPAGTDRTAVAYAALARLVRTQALRITPGIEDFMALHQSYIRVMAARARFHVEAHYLTGQPREDWNDSDAESYMGRLGTFLKVYFPHSILAKSPHFEDRKIEGYKDFDPMYRKNLQIQVREKLQSSTAPGSIPAAELVQNTEVAIEALRTTIQPLAGPLPAADPEEWGKRDPYWVLPYYS